MNVCGQCGDDFDEHVCIATTQDPLDGGIILCPRRLCRCYSTWSPKFPGHSDHPPKRVPDAGELAALHERVWAEG